MSLPTLKPRLGTLSTAKAPTLQAKAGTTTMQRGRAWMAKRLRVALAYGYRCAGSGCGMVWRPEVDHIDHRIPREQGGSNDESNLQPLCRSCHDLKTASEAGARAGKR